MDSKESNSPAYVAVQAGTTTYSYLAPGPHSVDCYKIPALFSVSKFADL